MKKVINLCFQSEYSFFESPTKINEYIKFAKKNSYEAVVLSDHNNVYGYAEFRKLCSENEIKAIYGIDLDFEKGRLILLAKNIDGFQQIKMLSYLKSKMNHLKLEMLNDENLIVINHPLYGYKNIHELKEKLKNFYFYDSNNLSSNIYIKDARILKKEEHKSLELINKLKDLKLENDYDYTFEIKEEKLNETIKNNIEKIVNECNVIFEEKKNLLPNFSNNPFEMLKEKIRLKLNYRNDLKIYDKKIVEERIRYELEVIQKLNVENYFLIISDLISWAKNNDIFIGPGRGSVSGSLIAYIIGITEINPLEFNLFFERFLNEERVSMPDIDIDIQDDKREKLLDYLKEKYGEYNVAQICTFQRMGAKQTLKDCARFLDIPFNYINDINKLISGSDSLEESFNKNVKFRSKIESEEKLINLYQLALLIESLPRQTGIHAAGVVISKNKIIDSIPVIEIDDKLITQFSMEYIEDWDLLKIDLLGLRTLTIIKRMIEEINVNFDKNFTFEQISLNDEKTNKLLSSGKVFGIFQLESPGMINTIKKVKINSFNDLVDVISLFRPGPLSNIPKYIENKNNKSLIDKVSPEYDKIVNLTNGIIIYQEQIMEIIQKVAGLSFAKADILRRGISKKKIEDIIEMKKVFISGAIKNNISENEAEKIYEQIVKFAEYGFNKSHAVAYASLSYKMAFIKARFPLCFYSAIISTTPSVDVINKCAIEARELKFNIESPLINKISSSINHDKKNTIYLPLTFIKGLGSVANNKLIQEKEENGNYLDFFDFVARAKKIGIGDSIINILICSNTLREFGNMKTLLGNIDKALSYASAISYEDKNTNEIVLDLSAKKPKLEIMNIDLKFEAENENKFLGMIYNAFVTSKYETNDKLINLKVGIEYKIVLSINNKKEVMNKFKKMSYVVEVSDSSNAISIWFNEKKLDIYKQLEVNTIGYASIIKLDRNGKEYYIITKWERIN